MYLDPYSNVPHRGEISEFDIDTANIVGVSSASLIIYEFISNYSNTGFY